MTPEEQKEARKTSRLIRAARKQNGLTQSDIAKTLGVSQSALSKFEAGILMPSAAQWYALCDAVHITPESSWRLGCIDRRTTTILSDDRRAGSFKIPARYSQHQGVKVRWLVPFIDFAELKLGAGQ